MCFLFFPFLLVLFSTFVLPYTHTHTHTPSAAHHILKKSDDSILVEEKKTADTNQILQEAREHLEESRNELKTSRKLL